MDSYLNALKQNSPSKVPTVGIGYKKLLKLYTVHQNYLLLSKSILDTILCLENIWFSPNTSMRILEKLQFKTCIR